MKFTKIIIDLPNDFADLYPELYVHGRGQDPRGHDIEAWEKAEAERVARVEARRLAAEASARTTKSAKSEAAE